jgi:hypothetical protein
MALTKISRSLLDTGVSDSSDATAITINSSENVGIGTSSPSYKLHTSGSDAIQAWFQSTHADTCQIQLSTATTNSFARITNNAGTLIYESDITADNASSGHQFKVDGSERMRIDSSGNVGIGTSSPQNNLHIFTNNGDEGILIKATGDTSNGIISDANRGNAGAGINSLTGKWNGTAVADMTFLTGDDTTNKDNGVIIFRTSSADNLAERMRITNAGEVLINDSARRGTNWRGQLQVTQIDTSNAAGISCISGNDEIAGTFALYSSSTASAAISVDPDAARGSSALYFLIDNVQKAVLDSSGNFTITGSYSSSDRTLKENIVTLPSQLETVKQLNPVSFDWIERAEDGSTKSSIGFIAQEIETLYPNLVNTPVADPDMSNTTTKSLNYAVMTAILTKAIQEQQTIIDDLKTRIETLEG